MPPEHTSPKALPQAIDLKKTKALTITWNDGSVSTYSIAFLRKNSPSADAKEQRKELAANPLTVLPASSDEPLTATDAELVGRYAIKLSFSDGHRTGLYTWEYLRSLNEVDSEIKHNRQ